MHISQFHKFMSDYQTPLSSLCLLYKPVAAATDLFSPTQNLKLYLFRQTFIIYLKCHHHYYNAFKSPLFLHLFYNCNKYQSQTQWMRNQKPGKEKKKTQKLQHPYIFHPKIEKPFDFVSNENQQQKYLKYQQSLQLSTKSINNYQKINQMQGSQISWITAHFYRITSNPEIRTVQIIKENINNFKKAIIYCETQFMCRNIFNYLPTNLNPIIMTYSYPLKQRQERYFNFILQEHRILITNLQPREIFINGFIDLENVNLIINVTIPQYLQTYKRRIAKSKQLSKQTNGAVINLISYQKQQRAFYVINELKNELKINLVQYKSNLDLVNTFVKIQQNQYGHHQNYGQNQLDKNRNQRNYKSGENMIDQQSKIIDKESFENLSNFPVTKKAPNYQKLQQTITFNKTPQKINTYKNIPNDQIQKLIPLIKKIPQQTTQLMRPYFQDDMRQVKSLLRNFKDKIDKIDRTQSQSLEKQQLKQEQHEKQIAQLKQKLTKKDKQIKNLKQSLQKQKNNKKDTTQIENNPNIEQQAEKLKKKYSTKNQQINQKNNNDIENIHKKYEKQINQIHLKHQTQVDNLKQQMDKYRQKINKQNSKQNERKNSNSDNDDQQKFDQKTLQQTISQQQLQIDLLKTRQSQWTNSRKTIEKENKDLKEKVQRYQFTIKQLKSEIEQLKSKK